MTRDSPTSNLPIYGSAPERADAARNRRLILAAAARLFARDGVACTSMDAIAAEAGVGKGTVFRRFRDRAELAYSLLETSETDFQEAFIRGPAPLGPGAPPVERLIAFGAALLERIADHGELLLAAQSAGSPGRRFDGRVYAAYQAHLVILIREAAPALDAQYTAESLLSTLSAEAVLHQLRMRGMPLDRLVAGWEDLVRRLVLGPSP